MTYYHWLGAEAEKAARDEATRQQLERELGVEVIVIDTTDADEYE